MGASSAVLLQSINFLNDKAILFIIKVIMLHLVQRYTQSQYTDHCYYSIFHKMVVKRKFIKVQLKADNNDNYLKMHQPFKNGTTLKSNY